MESIPVTMPMSSGPGPDPVPPGSEPCPASGLLAWRAGSVSRTRTHDGRVLTTAVSTGGRDVADIRPINSIGRSRPN